MPHANYPTAEDLAQYLQDQGVTDTVSLLRMPQAIGASISAFGRAVDRKMLADTVASARTFTPPTTRDGLLFLPDFVELESIVYQPAGSTSETFALATDYTLQPIGALTGTGDYAPYSAIAFRRFWPQPMNGDLQNSLTITAKWGYAVQLPDDAWEAMLARAAARLVIPLGVAATGGVRSYEEAGVTEQYGTQGLYGGLVDNLNDIWGEAVQRYRRWTL